jgi:small subunit ribosomal protein S8
MALSDPISELLTMVRNAMNAEHRYVDCSWSKIKQRIVEILKNQGFIEKFLVKTDERQRGEIRIYLKYREGRRPVIQGLKRISKPGCRRYISHTEIPFYYGGMGVSILSTSSGVMDGKEAMNKKVGGELLCLVW